MTDYEPIEAADTKVLLGVMSQLEAVKIRIHNTYCELRNLNENLFVPMTSLGPAPEEHKNSRPSLPVVDELNEEIAQINLLLDDLQKVTSQLCTLA